MIPKVDCCVEAVRSGVKSAIILDGRVPIPSLIELLSNEGHRHHAGQLNQERRKENRYDL